MAELQFETHDDVRAARRAGLLKGGDIYILPGGGRVMDLHEDGGEAAFLPEILEQRPHLCPPRVLCSKAMIEAAALLDVSMADLKRITEIWEVPLGRRG